MKEIKRILLLCLGFILFLPHFYSCESTEQRDKRHAEECYRVLEECLNNKNKAGFKRLFNSEGKLLLNDANIEKLFEVFSSGITLHKTPYDDNLTVTDWIEDGFYGKNISWAREIINNATGEIFNICALVRTHDQLNEDIGIIDLTIYPIEKTEDFMIWWGSLEEEERPNGLVIYGIE